MVSPKNPGWFLPKKNPTSIPHPLMFEALGPPLVVLRPRAAPGGARRKQHAGGGVAATWTSWGARISCRKNEEIMGKWGICHDLPGKMGEIMGNHQEKRDKQEKI